MTSLEMETSDINSVQTHTPKEDVDDAVFLSWKDLWVTVRDGRHGSRSILQGLTAYAQPGELLAIMGPSVREAVYYSAQLQLPDSMSNSEKKERAERTIREMGLQDARNTRIGGWGAKGLSGGQKRRDLEQGMSDATPTEEVINTLIQSYTSSETYQEVRKKVAEINKEARGSLLMFISTFLTFMAIGGFPSFVEEMKVIFLFYKDYLHSNFV
ncbi:hypothetical protein GH714_007807 [Hevea brasiliensis]|uniref:Uncharacterized protein n=1 Tax=Hevea brasiliensis TaxID=3981 RepID=A0A6A6L194_HEVBR|nr:hypothetical protein GH714_007807 [Hevea brasiliensis]